ncbi:plasmid mobilization relaxosome protein MobC [Helicobacter sp. MIT 03-1614]|uniref:plasmid mobilization relaxosome protein MobC n=1 Tax=Helicobacter TaxID=209 RepID=UPI00051332F6|nr:MULTISPECIES: plasmid mobilization relaxosome protein MobC [Helicobacter]QOQ92000.1 plasmid mobilization relaxosome protein MobC [Helicobacter cinaedi]TLD85686.1 plasmid mobilization relaxosome protein MobC [Helicobacter sp. MIT 03-1616]TLD86697.1 plasmid mobilization relaxosome protein MobC [Helicobacter sp. MIT 03-1614]BDB65792.1 hypothetical protein T36_2271 [Helicobacter cinaedi]
METKKVLICLKLHDYELLNQMAKKQNISKSKFIRQLLRIEEAQKILEILDKSSKFNAEMLLEISRVAGNINQIAHHLNLGFRANEESFTQEAKETKRIFLEFQSIAKQNQKLLQRILNA